jgi:hypothetical protein
MWESSTALCQPRIVVSGEKNRHKGRECGIDCHQIVILSGTAKSPFVVEDLDPRISEIKLTLID